MILILLMAAVVAVVMFKIGQDTDKNSMLSAAVTVTGLWLSLILIVYGILGMTGVINL